ncbi:mitochondrial protein [Sporothrix brasiliensis 5110]|uniref:Mitochondrial protein n=1 Tax=Sporothrix brasiliensis 5110 TaxID=1398154 RepID=A0A0C2IIM1_9PEZI|nr:mitochondrial protein [Sporothrix brasiliensis 5110]KIH89026.1 mitochondrial protein [Sporothrix brasiliensis 5110]
MSLLRRATCTLAALRPKQAPHVVSIRWFGGGPGSYGRGGPGPRRGDGGGRGSRRRGGGGRYTGLLAVAFVVGAGVYTYSSISSDKAKGKDQQQPPSKVIVPKAEIEFETAPLTSNADIREVLSPQHRQVKNSLENPGVYAWGSNSGRVVAPDSTDSFIKEPRRIGFFDGQILRDLRLDSEVGIAVTEGGDVLQWGVGYWGKTATASKVPLAPVTTLKGKDILKVALSNDRVIALSANGDVYSLPISKEDSQPPSGAVIAPTSGPSEPSPTPAASSWFWSRPTDSTNAATFVGSNVRKKTPSGLGWGERVVDIRGGQEHCLLLTSKGRVFSAVSSMSSFPTKGQLGVPGLNWETRPRERPLDAPYEISGLKGITATQIATGDYHSLVLARDGSLYSFGDNSTGQLGIPASPLFPSSDAPVKVPVERLYELPGDSKAVELAGRDAKDGRAAVRVTSIAAGGATSFFTVDVKEKAAGGWQKGGISTSSDTWSSGSGIYGSLGTGKWVHISTTGPGKIRALSGLSEYSEALGALVPIRPAHIEVGATHASAVLDNATRVGASPSSRENADTNWGADTLWWGGNEYYQLGTGKRNNQSEPVHIAPLDGARRRSTVTLPPDSTAAQAQASLDLARERLALTPRTTVRLAGNGRKVSIEQRVVCGRYVSGVYSGV